MKNSPLVSVIMPVYNGEQYIAVAIESILNQTYKNYELIVVNDGSTDGTEKILNSYHGKIVLINQPNMGVATALNEGIRHAQGKYIARLDSDDLAVKNKLEIQVDYLEANSDIGILGSRSYLLDSKSKKWGIQKVPYGDENIRWIGLFKSPFISSTVIFRKKLLEQMEIAFKKELSPADDYDLWTRLLQVTNAANLNVPLIHYRMHTSNLTTTEREKMLTASYKISDDFIKKLLPDINTYIKYDEVGEIRELLYANTKHYKELLFTRSQTVVNYLKLWELFAKERSLSQEEIRAIQNKVIIRACQMAFFPPLADDCEILLPYLYQLDKTWWFTFLVSFPSGFSSFIRERFFWKFAQLSDSFRKGFLLENSDHPQSISTIRW